MNEEVKQKPAPKRAVDGVEVELGEMDWELGGTDVTDDRPEGRLADASEVSK